ncbi:hypothetical protein WJX79_010333 [Trebouxia sp. C0005]
MAATIIKSLGTAIRTAGQAIDSMGAAMQGKYAYRETLSKHQTLQAFANKRPQLAEDIFVAPNSSMIGDVSLGKSSSVWYGAVLRGPERIHAAENAKTPEEIQIDKDAREDRLERDPDYDSHLGIERDPVTREITHVAAST